MLTHRPPFCPIGMLAIAIALSACAAPPPPGAMPAVQVYKSNGSVQCAEGGTGLDALRRQLEQAQIRVMRASCGTDGRMYAAMCGAPDGRIGIFEIPEAEAARALKLGFAALRNLPDARAVPCK